MRCWLRCWTFVLVWRVTANQLQNNNLDSKDIYRGVIDYCLPAACCCWTCGWRRNGWLKKTSKGILSLAFRRKSPKRRSWSSGVVPTGSLKNIACNNISNQATPKQLTSVPNLHSSRKSFSTLAVCELGMELFPSNTGTRLYPMTRDLMQVKR